MQVAKLTKTQTILIIVAMIYLLIGTAFGLILKSAIPAVNAWGVIYYALTWPLWLISGSMHLHFMPIWNWMFTFKN